MHSRHPGRQALRALLLLLLLLHRRQPVRPAFVAHAIARLPARVAAMTPLPLLLLPLLLLAERRLRWLPPAHAHSHIHNVAQRIHQQHCRGEKGRGSSKLVRQLLQQHCATWCEVEGCSGVSCTARRRRQQLACSSRRRTERHPDVQWLDSEPPFVRLAAA